MNASLEKSRNRKECVLFTFTVNGNMEIALLFVIHIYFVFQAGALVYIELQIT